MLGGSVADSHKLVAKSMSSTTATTTENVAYATLRNPRPTPDDDLKRCWQDRHIWGLLALNDIRAQYRHSTLGTLWITASTAVFAITIGVIYGQFFGTEISKYLPYFAIGFIIWTYLSGAVNEATRTLIGQSSLIQTSRLPLIFHVLRMLAKNTIVFAHNAVVLFAIWLWFRWDIGLEALWAIPGFVMLFLTMFGLSLTLAIVCVRYRDIPPLVQAVTQFVFFASPIIWYAEQVKVAQAMVWLNPVTHFLAVVRDPLLGKPVDVGSLAAATAITVVSLVIAIFIYRRYRDRVSFWV
ncbi:ABC transporter permease protein [Ahrensia sp. R2A130]|nr:ABC transporter permease protein [Ahrensia sp. R2A130]